MWKICQGAGRTGGRQQRLVNSICGCARGHLKCLKELTSVGPFLKLRLLPHSPYFCPSPPLYLTIYWAVLLVPAAHLWKPTSAGWRKPLLSSIWRQTGKKSTERSGIVEALIISNSRSQEKNTAAKRSEILRKKNNGESEETVTWKDQGPACSKNQWRPTHHLLADERVAGECSAGILGRGVSALMLSWESQLRA